MLSAVILTKNEQENIADCISGLSFASEIILIDDNSSDNTVKIARSLGAKVWRHGLLDDFAQQRNYGLQKAKREWVLFVDADERVSQDLAQEIKKTIKITQFDGFYFQREYCWLGKRLKWGEWATTKFLSKYGHNRVLRLGKRKAGVWRRRVHEYWDIKNTSTLESPLLHQSDKSVSYTLLKLNQQSQLHALASQQEGKKASVFKIIFMPFAKFVTNFYFKQGYKDGLGGFVVAVLMSFHSFLAWSQLWLSQKN